ncbi:N-6 DNA methylase [Brevibacillus choshinensis]|uniref:site-specific DNA-methyltransferase (adenine-specific) n=1 Tax=Brevibacillus choshinensis TaxID=54911 RepID=A0ABX7FIQ2_BRECH|nr:N-6 DNA methylase [Brevibacillus choshinensis]QRG65966.1 N-6 DNA methylase [Brevibacillus choshinensis]
MKNAIMAGAEQDAWVIGDIWRGEMQVSEMRHYLQPMATYKLLCENLDHNFIIPEGYSWEALTSNGIDFGKKMFIAFQELESMNPSLKDVFTITDFTRFQDDLSLYKVADTVLNRQSYCRESYDDSSPLTGTVTRYLEGLFEAFVSREGVYGGEVSSPKSITTLLPRLLDITSGTISDHASGISGFLIEAYKYAQLNQSEVSLYGQEINAQTRAMGILNLIIHGMYHEVADVKLGNTITNPQWKDEEGQLMKFDGILVSPPFAVSNWGYEEAEKDVYGRFRYGLPSRAYGDMAFVLHSVASLKKDGKAVIVVPHGVLQRGASEAKIRANLIQENLIEAVIGLPSNLFIGTGIPVAVLIINKSKPESLKDRILFINAEDGFGKAMRNQNVLRESDIEDIVDAYHNLKPIDGYSRIVPISELSENDWSLHPLRYFEKAEVSSKIGKTNINRKKYEQSDLPKITLGNIAEVERGLNPTKNETDDIESTHYLVNLVDVQEGKIIADELKGVVLGPKRARDYELESGDILLSSRGTMLKMTVVTPEDLKEKPLVFSQNFLRIRVSNFAQYEPHYIKAFLESPIGQYYLQAYQRGTTVTVLSHRDVASIKLPNLTIEKQREIAEMLLQSDEAYHTAIELARKVHEQSYKDSYQLMGISDSFVEIN